MMQEGSTLKGRVALITGAASGIGRAGAILFASHGAQVLAVDIDRVGLQSTVTHILDKGGAAHAITADLSELTAARALVSRALNLSGALDIVWNNVGITGPLDMENIDFDLYRRTIDLNLTSGIFIAGEAIPHLRARGGGSILFTSSVSGLTSSPQYAMYSATKSGIIGYVKTMARRLAKEGIRVNAVCPGPVNTLMVTRMADNSIGGLTPEQYIAGVTAAVPMGRAAEPVEIAEAALWLSSDSASFVTGVALPVDGGYTA